MKYLLLSAAALTLAACTGIGGSRTPAEMAVRGCNQYATAQESLNVAAASQLFYKNEIETIDGVRARLNQLCLADSPYNTSNVAIRIAVGELASRTNNGRTTALAIFGASLAVELIQSRREAVAPGGVSPEVDDDVIEAWIDMQGRLVAANSEWDRLKAMAPDAP